MKTGVVPPWLLVVVSLWSARLFVWSAVPQSPGDARLTRRQPAPENPAALRRRLDGEAALRSMAPRVHIERGPISGGARWIATSQGFLTGPNGTGLGMSGAPALAELGVDAADEHRVVKSFIAHHSAIFGHDPTALTDARIQRDVTSPNNGLRTTTWQQQIDGLPIHRATLTAHVTGKGELAAIGSELLATLNGAASPEQRRRLVNGDQVPISAAQAWVLAAAQLGYTLVADTISEANPPQGVARTQRLAAPGWSEVRASLIWLPMNASTVRLCWRLQLVTPSSRLGYEMFVDADSGEILWRRGVTEDASAPATFRVFTTESPTPFSPGFSTPVTNQPPAAARTLTTLTSLDSTASPNGWIEVGDNELAGNNASVRYYQQTSPNSWTTKAVEGSPSRTFDFPLDLAASPASRVKATSVNAFYWVNLAHDRFHKLGFTEGHRNCQLNNFGRGGEGGDPVTVRVNDPFTEDNASMLTWNEGGSPEMSLGIYTGPDPDRESALNGETILHEYGHAVSNRLVGDGTGLDTEAVQSRGMGEGWSDFFAMALTSAPTDPVHAVYPYGAYTAYRKWGTEFQENYYMGTRRYPYCTDMSKNPLTFKDIDPDQADPHIGIPISSPLATANPAEVHSQGEVWCAMLWEVRANLITKHGGVAGNQLALQLVMDGLRLSPNNPTFVAARNAILVADAVLTGGSNQAEIWAGFAKRGLGTAATCPPSTTTAGVVESFDSLDALTVYPADATEVSGPQGGPFAPSAKTFTLSNGSGVALNWQARTEPPLELGSSSGLIPANGTQKLNLTINATAAGSLAPGGYSYSVYITNRASGVVIRRLFTVLVGIDQPPTERFSNEDSDAFDLSGRSLWFEPVDGGTHYVVCRSTPSPTSFPVNPALGQTLDFTNTLGVIATLTNNIKIPFYGALRSAFEIRLDGSIVPGAQDSPFEDYLGYLGHFCLPRVSGLRQSYAKTVGRISWLQTADSLCATWENVAQSQSASSPKANFQIQLMFDGRIRVTFLSTAVPTGITGLSPGGDLPPLFVETDLGAARACSEPMVELKLPTSVTEGGLLPARGSVMLPGRTSASERIVTLKVNDPGELNIPSSVVIPPGQASALFDLSAVNDSVRDGSQVVFVTASRTGFTPAVRSLKVHDNESATLSLSLPSSRTEGEVLGFGQLSLSAPAGALMGVELSSSDPELLPVPALVFLSSGQSSVLVPLVVPDNNRIEGTRNVVITARVQNWGQATDTVAVLDNDSTDLALLAPVFRNESEGTVTNGAQVRIEGILTTNLSVLLVSDDESEVRTPIFSSVIPAGATNVFFPLFIQDDLTVDGAVLVRLRALAPGFTPATNVIFVADNDGPPEPYQPQPEDGATNVPPHTDLSWGRIEGDLIRNGGFETGDLTGWQLESFGTGLFAITGGGYDPQSVDGPFPPLAGAYSVLSDQAGAGKQTLWQEVLVPVGATEVTLRWTDRIRSHGGVFGSSHGFRVEVRNTNNAVLATVFSTTTNTPALSDVTNRSVSLAAWRGEWIRIAFVEQDSGGYLNVHLDNVQLWAPPAAPTFFDVYFGTDPSPDASEYVGSTTNAFWALGPLLPETAYYWQLRSRRNSVTNSGPIWSFSTGGNMLFSTLIASNAVWKYLATTVNPGSAWNDPGFNDSAWAQGPGKLGFGGDGENTDIEPARGSVTTFAFRRTFTVANPKAVLGLEARLIRDDGAAVYLNGKAVWVDNLPARYGWSDEALSSLEASLERQWITNRLDPSLLVPGQNLIAVEIHQGPTRLVTPDLGFALELRGIYDNGNHTPFVELTSPVPFSVFQQPIQLPLAATASDTSATGNPIPVSSVEFFADGDALATDSSSPFSFAWPNAPAGHHVLKAAVTDSGGLTADSDPVNVLILPPSGSVLAALIPRGSVWSYLDNGVYPGAKWTQIGFASDRTKGWKTGPAQLGYGDGDESTVIGYGGRQLQRHITTWFRKQFIQPAALSALSMRVLRDDGVVLYLNGTEIFRNNLPPSPGTILTNTLATVTISGDGENDWVQVPLQSSVVFPLLKPGVNVIAAEVHQSSSSSPDLSFDLELTGVGNPPPQIELTSPVEGSTLVHPPSVLLSAAASDAYGGIALVQFYRDGANLGSDTLAPYQVVWSNPPVGSYSLTAVATDLLGLSSTSPPVHLFILGPVVINAALTAEGMVLLTWPAAAVGYVLESADSLSDSIQWTLVGGSPQLVGSEFQAVLPAGDPQRYFRLRSP
ncbi:MAG: M36 family metallopeptidase [Verrucomicrobiales bacterium]|nr:M36 family metallopeptidase [Verrucomicrobiales bacterium]